MIKNKILGNFSNRRTFFDLSKKDDLEMPENFEKIEIMYRGLCKLEQCGRNINPVYLYFKKP